MVTTSLRGRFAAAIGLMIGFYLLAAVIVGALLAVPLLELFYLRRLHLQIALGCLIAAGVIVWAVFPRRLPFEVPGPRLQAADHPRLFAELQALAQASHQAMPAEVYLIEDLNAWVTERGGMGGGRVIGLGLPLMQLLSVPEFRAVLAHEFGHYHGGDTGLGLLVYRTRSSIGRTIEALDSNRSVLSLPFQWYAAAFMRVTQAIARRQEFDADRFAAQHAGTAAVAGGLHKVHLYGPAYGAYWHSEAAPVLRAGFRPPLLGGYQRFLAAAQVRESVERERAALLETKSDPYASHPSLRERLDALGPADTTAEAGEPSALGLLGDPQAAEAALLAFLGGESAARLTEIAWEEVGERVFAPLWQRLVFEHAAALQAITPRGLPDLLSNGAAHGGLLDQLGLTHEQRGQATWLLGAALGFQLHRAGWQIHSLPGEPIVLTHGEEPTQQRIQPQDTIERLAAGGAAAAADLALLEAAGIADQGLASGAARVD